ncbi:hypothetical protein [Thiocystis minor]|uniref:hypothetical protein n=1 Tax=Thiocystis minor TaxID=61597 RepID=UPI001911E91D|nr:hypothetical protein [Thiocystis minor]
MSRLTLQPGNAQWIGTRPEQQDAFGFAGCSAQGANPPGGVLVVLADGMGGLREGRAASQLAVKNSTPRWLRWPKARCWSCCSIWCRHAKNWPSIRPGITLWSI